MQTVKCTCGKTFVHQRTDNKCNELCPSDALQKCGDTHYIRIYAVDCKLILIHIIERLALMNSTFYLHRR